MKNISLLLAFLFVCLSYRALAQFGPVSVSDTVGPASIDTTKLESDAVTSAKIINGAVETAKIATDAVIAAKVINGGIETAKLAADSVINAKVLNATLTGAKLVNLTIDSSKLQANSVDSEKLNANSVIGTKILNATIDTAKLNATIQAQLANGGAAITALTSDVTATGPGSAAATIAASAVDTGKIKDDSVTTVKLLNLNVTTAKLADASVDTTKIKADSVNTAAILNGAVDTNKLPADAVTGPKILNGAVTGAKVASLTLDSTKLAAASVDVEKLASNSVDTGKLKDDSVTNAKVLNFSIDSNKLTTSSVQTEKIAAGAVDSYKLKSDAGSLAQVSNQRMFVSGSNVGVGATSASSPLTVKASGVAMYNYSMLGSSAASTIMLVHPEAPNALAQIAFGYDDGLRPTVAVIGSVLRGWGGEHQADIIFATKVNSAGGTTATENVRIQGGGNVGIGTTNPETKLVIQTGTLDTHKMTVGGSGDPTGIKVGIGITNPSATLDVTGGSAKIPTVISSMTVRAALEVVGDVLIAKGTDDTHKIYADAGSDGTYPTLGIGTAGSYYALDVRNLSTSTAFGGFTTERGPSIYDGQINIGRDPAYRLEIWNSPSAAPQKVAFDNTWDNAGALTDFRMRVRGTPISALALRGDGKVGIGTTSPSVNLHIVSGTTDSGKIMAGDATHAACLILGDVDGGGCTKCYALNGTMTCAADATCTCGSP